MKIQSTPYACFVSLRNGLTLELTFEPEPEPEGEHPHRIRASGVWMFHEEVLFEAHVGLA